MRRRATVNKPVSFIRVAITGTEPVSLADAKLHCRVDHADDDLKLTLNIRSAREMAENILRRRIVTQTVDLVYDGAGTGMLYLDGMGESNLSIVSVTYRNELNTEITLAPTDYEIVFRGGAFLRIKENVSLKLSGDYPRIVVRATAGWGNDTPATVRDFILLIVESLYVNRGAHTDGALGVNPMFTALLDPYILPVV